MFKMTQKILFLLLLGAAPCAMAVADIESFCSCDEVGGKICGYERDAGGDPLRASNGAHYYQCCHGATPNCFRMDKIDKSIPDGHHKGVCCAGIDFGRKKRCVGDDAVIVFPIEYECDPIKKCCGGQDVSNQVFECCIDGQVLNSKEACCKAQLAKDIQNGQIPACYECKPQNDGTWTKEPQCRADADCPPNVTCVNGCCNFPQCPVGSVLINCYGGNCGAIEDTWNSPHHK